VVEKGAQMSEVKEDPPTLQTNHILLLERKRNCWLIQGGRKSKSIRSPLLDDYDFL